ncbi:MAG TPA: hypothetical protein VFI02_16760 [Armatimonadota bacterium]|nr:hypothetical protein [Armatimonadota bacterium]
MNKWKSIVGALISMAVIAFVVAIPVSYYGVAYTKYCYYQIASGKDTTANYQAIAKYPDQAFRLAQEKIASGRPKDEVIALCILRQIGDPRSLELLCRSLQDGQQPETAASCLSSIGTPQAIACLIDSADSPLQEVRQPCYRVLLAVLQDGRQRDLILRGLSDASANVQVCVFDHLADLPEDQLEKYREPLSAMLKGGGSKMQRGYAARMLAKIGDEGGLQYCMNEIRNLANSGAEADAQSAQGELETLSLLCGARIMPEVISLVREFPAHRRRPLLSALYFLTKKEFASLRELEQWWEKNGQRGADRD